ncbi:MAG: hypothetical protein ACRDTJ_28570 [Pseudonocardiaceae bacterium]
MHYVELAGGQCASEIADGRRGEPDYVNPYPRFLQRRIDLGKLRLRMQSVRGIDR